MLKQINPGTHKENTMKIARSNSRTSLIAIGAALVAACTATASVNKNLPATTEDGLTLIPAKHVDALYWREGATLAPYTAVKIAECTVAFRKDWLRSQNSGRSTVGTRVRPEDMERIKAALAEEFDKEFTKVLEKAGYSVVEEAGDNVLLLHPSIINLDVAAPDLQTAGMVRTYTASAGEMTLYVELYDSATGAKIGQALDRQRAMDTGHFSYSNRVTNRTEADRILRKWAGLLVEALDEAKAR